MESSLTKEQIEVKIQEFIYYFIKKVETKLDYYSKIQNPNLTPEASNTTIGNLLSSLVKNVPVAGKTLSEAVGNMDRKISKERMRSKTLAFKSAIEMYKENIEAFRKILVMASYEVFCCFEKQLLSFISHKKSIWLIAELGSDFGRRFMLYIYQNGYPNVTVEAVVNSVVFAKWNLKNEITLLIKSPSDCKSKIHHIYRETAVYDKEAKTGYINKFSNASRFGFRLKLSKEQLENWEEVVVSCNYNYVTDVKQLDAHIDVILEYILKKDSELLTTETRNQKQIIEQNEQIINLLVPLNNLIDSRMKYLNKDQNLLYEHFDLPSISPKIKDKRTQRNDIFKELYMRLNEEGNTDQVASAKEAMVDIIQKLKYL